MCVLISKIEHYLILVQRRQNKQMQVFQRRLETYRKRRKWPHKSPEAESMARAGFFFTPSASEPDLVQCFLCDKRLDGWDAEDDPLVEHLAHCPDCGFALALSHDAKMHPSMEKYIVARVQTFADWWPHEHKRGWVPRARTLAEAGFYYAPSASSEDMVHCAFCDLGLDGWEQKDEPMEEHRRRQADCMLFDGEPTVLPVGKKRMKRVRGGRIQELVEGTVKSDKSEEKKRRASGIMGPPTKRRITRSSMSRQSVVSEDGLELPKPKSKRKSSQKARTFSLQSPQPPLATPAGLVQTITEEEERSPSPKRKVPEEVLAQPDHQRRPSKAGMRPATPHKTPSLPRRGSLPRALPLVQPQSMPRAHAMRNLQNLASPQEEESLFEQQIRESTVQLVGTQTPLPPIKTPAPTTFKFSSPHKPKLPLHTLTEAERAMTVETWMRWNTRGEAERLQAEGERIVGLLELEGRKARDLVERLLVAG